MSNLESKLTQSLSELLADTYLLYLKTQNFHWNVIGPNFHSLHEMFEQQYTELAVAADDIAERIRALGHPAPGSFEQFIKLAVLKETTEVLKANEMLKTLAEDHKAIIERLHSFMPIAEEVNDEVTIDLFIQRLQVHEKARWMLVSSLG